LEPARGIHSALLHLDDRRYIMVAVVGGRLNSANQEKGK